MRQLLRQHPYEVTVNQDFDGVIRGCSTAQGRNEENGAWLGPDIIEAFTRLHHLGHAASVEVWQPASTTEGRKVLVSLL
jgi:leucyl/phenylalanyl-tRNA--protein transferase